MGDLKKLGPAGEEHACGMLKKRGDRLVARNFSCARGELDLVSWHGDTLVFTEVRARSSTKFGSPAETVTAAKQQRVRRAAEWFLMQNLKTPKPPPCRFDVVWIVADQGNVKDSGVIEGAF